MSALLELRELRAYYGRVQVLHGVDLDVEEGEIVAVLGANGAGKTTLLRAISRTVRTDGSLRFAGEALDGSSTEAVARMGIGHVPEGRGTFTDLTVGENLRLGALARARSARDGAREDMDTINTMFPMLAEMRGRRAGALSGGQQQMLAIARALLGRPRLLLVDELSLGLAPLITDEIFGTLRELQSAWSLTVVMAEQNVRLALNFADRGYVLDSGEVLVSGPADELAAENAVGRAYLGA